MGFCDSGQSQSNQTKWVDPLGPSASQGGTGAPELRNQLFNYLGGYLPSSTQAGQTYASALQSQANNPIWGQVASNASKNAAGDYLAGSPVLDRALAQQAGQARAAAAGSDARIRSQYAKNGMSFSTGNQQAQEANEGATNASINANNSNAYLQNYLAERQNQNNAGNQYASAAAAPLSYLGQVSGAYTQPLSQAGNLLSGLSSGGQTITTGSSGVYSPSTGSDILNGLGAL